MNEYGYHDLDTPVGTVFVRASGAENLMLTTHDGSHTVRPITINGVHYTATLHLVKLDSGWGLYRDEHGFTTHALYMSRVDAFRNGKYNADPSTAARKKATAVLLEAGREWAAANPELLRAAEIERLQIELGRADDDLDKLEKQVTEVNERREAIIYQLIQLGADQVEEAT